MLNKDTTGALNYLSELTGDEELRTTAFWASFMDQWFYLATSRHLGSAISHYKEQKYEETIEFLKNSIEIFKSIKIGNAWKPCQTGLIMCTQSILEAQDIFLQNYDFKFLCTSRFSQDPLENQFSTVRSKNPRPAALEFKRILKNISVSQYLKFNASGNYEEDDSKYLPHFLDLVVSWKNQKHVTDTETDDKHILEDCSVEEYEIDKHDQILFSEEELTRDCLEELELQSLYSLAGATVRKLINRKKGCKNCLEYIIDDNNDDPVARFTRFKEKFENSFYFVSTETFNFFVKMELMTRYVTNNFLTKDSGLCEKIFQCMSSVLPTEFIKCKDHDILILLMKQFVNLRLKIASFKIQPNESNFNYGSKSMN